MKSTLVMKFGGKALENPDNFQKIVSIIQKKHQLFKRIVVVVSAMGDFTDLLLNLAHRVHDTPPKRELDMLISVGERISMSLLAMALDKQGVQAVSFTGSQSGIITCHEHSNAEILEVRPTRLFPHLEENKVVIVAGFQGVSCKGEITTLGRGGSDVSAVALGAALQADKVEFYKDVEGVYAEDPKKNPQAKLFRFLTYKQALALHDHVLHPRSILLASKKQLPLHVLPFKTYLFDTDFEKIRSHLYFKKDESAGFLKDQEGEIVPGFENVIGSLIGESIKSVEGFKEEKKRAKVH